MPKLGMASMESSLRLIGKPMPKIVSPAACAVADYVSAIGFRLASASLWKGTKRPAFASLLCGAAEIAFSTLTDDPPRVTKLISFPLHGKIDFRMGGMIAAMPQILAFQDAGEKELFTAQAAWGMQLNAAANAANVSNLDEVGFMAFLPRRCRRRDPVSDPCCLSGQ